MCKYNVGKWMIIEVISPIVWLLDVFWEAGFNPASQNTFPLFCVIHKTEEIINTNKSSQTGGVKTNCNALHCYNCLLNDKP